MELRFLLIFLFIATTVNKIEAQCAGTDSSITIWNKELDLNNQNINLFNLLNGSPETGGTWVSDDPFNKDALNEISGEVDLWNIHKSGSHSFTYTNQSCNETATVEILLGGYAGEDNVDGSANACSSGEVNLFYFLNKITRCALWFKGKKLSILLEISKLI